MFSAPVDKRFPTIAYYGKESPDYEWSVDPDNGFWIPIKNQASIGNHRGVDFGCPVGTIVYAMSDGFIVSARFENAIEHSFGAGFYITQLVMLPGYDSWTLRYTHLRSGLVKPGQRIMRHEIIGESGNPHLHVDLMDLRRQWKPIPIGDD